MQRITILPSQIQTSSSAQSHGNSIALTAEQDRYLTRVLRLQTGAKFEAIDGTGHVYLAELSGATGRIIATHVTAAPSRSRSIVLVCALPKGNHFDDIVRACTELGVTTILPALSERTLLQPSPHKLQRWRKIAQEAAEQSERTTIPTIAAPQGLQDIFSQLTDSTKYLCEPRGTQPHLLTCLQSLTVARSIILAIGPEGGWTEGEIKLAIAHGFELVSLGQQILRTITAPLVALAIVTAVADTTPVPKC